MMMAKIGLTPSELLGAISLIFINLFFCSPLIAQISIEKIPQNGVRIRIPSSEFDYVMKRVGHEFSITSIDDIAVRKLYDQLLGSTFNSDLIQKVSFENAQMDGFPSRIKMQLAGEHVDHFHHYPRGEKNHVVDFWKNPSISSTPQEKTTPEKVALKTKAKRNPASMEKKEKIEVEQDQHPEQFLDFRYGAAFVWDYPLEIPVISNIVDLANKTPEYFYPVKDVEKVTNEQDGHLQLIINFYQKRKFGLMVQSINLYRRKYSQEEAYTSDLFSYLEANSILRTNIYEMDDDGRKKGIKILSDLLNSSSNYHLKKGILLYLTQYYYSQKNYFDLVEKTQNLIQLSLENYDREVAESVVEKYLLGLIKLKQHERIQGFISDNKKHKLMSKNLEKSYEILNFAFAGEFEQAIKKYNSLDERVQKLLDPTVVYNMAEIYFQKGMIADAITAFDTFLTNGSHLEIASFARIRLGLLYDLQGASEAKIQRLYRLAIDRASHPAARIEAKLRLVGLNLIRKIDRSEADWKHLALIERSSDEEKMIEGHLKELLWLVRLRSLIIQSKYQEALQYLSAIPLDKMDKTRKLVFEADGSEILLAVLKDLYHKNEYMKLVRMWNSYEKTYGVSVASDDYLNYIVGDSLLKLKLEKTFLAHKEKIELKQTSGGTSKTYPLWIKRDSTSTGDYQVLLEIAHAEFKKDWKTIKNLAQGWNASNSVIKNYYIVHAMKELGETKELTDFVEQWLESDASLSGLNLASTSLVLRAYIDSIDKKNNTLKYRKVVKVMLEELAKFQTVDSDVAIFLENTYYDYLDNLANSSDKNDFELLSSEAGKFIIQFPNSPHFFKAKYWIALSNLKLSDTELASGQLNEIISNEKAPTFIKELCRAELSSLSIQERANNNR